MDVHSTIQGSSFVWDGRKTASNVRRHGVSFEEAATVFSDPLFALVDSSRNLEARSAVIGFSSAARLLIVVHLVVEDESIRIVSARLATREEETRYVE